MPPGSEAKRKASTHTVSEKDTPRLRLHCHGKQMHLVFFSLSLLSLFSFIAVSKLGTHIKLNICSIQTIKSLKKIDAKIFNKILAK